MYSNSRDLHLVAAVCLTLLVAVGGAHAQGYGLPAVDGVYSYGTPNLPAAEPWASSDTLLWGEGRFFDGGQTYSAGVQARVGQDTEAGLTLFHLTTSGDDPIAGAVRDSEATLIGLNVKWLAYRGDQIAVSVLPGIEYPIGDMEGTNTTIPATAVSDDIILELAVPVEYITEDGLILRAVPKYVGFDDSPSVNGTTIDGFGDVIALGLGGTYSDVEWSAMADVAIVLSGDNSIDADTNEPTDEMVWSAGGSWHGIDSDVRIDLFVTNAAGPTAASSIIATPDNSVGVGIRVSGEF